jgi:hypothetical protein
MEFVTDSMRFASAETSFLLSSVVVAYPFGGVPTPKTWEPAGKYLSGILFVQAFRC